jgi:hypothetical protein
MVIFDGMYQAFFLSYSEEWPREGAAGTLIEQSSCLVYVPSAILTVLPRHQTSNAGYSGRDASINRLIGVFRLFTFIHCYTTKQLVFYTAIGSRQSFFFLRILINQPRPLQHPRKRGCQMAPKRYTSLSHMAVSQVFTYPWLKAFFHKSKTFVNLIHLHSV